MMMFLISVDNLTCFSVRIQTLTGEGETGSGKEPVPLVVKEVSADANEN